jgi:hypothetical protein
MVRVSVRWAGDRDGCGSRTMRRAALVAFVLVAFLLLWLVVSSPASAASPVVRAWGPAPNSQTFTVPGGVTSVSITVEGAPGGSGFRGGSTGGSDTCTCAAGCEDSEGILEAGRCNATPRTSARRRTRGARRWPARRCN